MKFWRGFDVGRGNAPNERTSFERGAEVSDRLEIAIPAILLNDDPDSERGKALPASNLKGKEN